MTTFKTDIKLGERYRDDQTGLEGTATAVYFFQLPEGVVIDVREEVTGPLRAILAAEATP